VIPRVPDLRNMLGALGVRAFVQIPYWKIPLLGRPGVSLNCRGPGLGIPDARYASLNKTPRRALTHLRKFV